jgi:hypothetical protein
MPKHVQEMEWYLKWELSPPRKGGKVIYIYFKGNQLVKGTKLKYMNMSKPLYVAKCTNWWCSRYDITHMCKLIRRKPERNENFWKLINNFFKKIKLN